MPDYHQGTLVVTQKPHYPTMHTRETVTHLAAFGMDEKQVAVILKCTDEDVRKYYAAEIEHGLTRVNAQVMSAVLHQALHARDVAAMKFWLINKAGWRAGDQRPGLMLPGGIGADGEPTGELTVHERREVITKLLHRVTLEKRSVEKTIEGRVVSNQAGTGARTDDARRSADGNGQEIHRRNNGASASTQEIIKERVNNLLNTQQKKNGGGNGSNGGGNGVK